MRNQICWVVILCCSITWGQELKVNWRASFCKIGEPIQLRMRIENAPDSVVHIPMYGEFNVALSKKPKEKDAAGLMEVVGTFQDTTFMKGKQRIWEGTYTMIPWDTGSYYLQSLEVQLPDTLLIGSIPVLDVTFRDLAKSHDITELQSTIPADIWLWLKKYYWIILLILFSGIAFYILRRRKKQQLERALTFTERTLLEIERLQKDGLWKSGEYSLHYVRFSVILRNYLGESYQLNLMERTSNESLLLLKERGVAGNLLDEIQHLLHISDRVKFAQDTPSDTTIIEGLTALKSLVNTVHSSIENTTVTNG